MFRHIAMTVATTVMGTIIGWLLNAIKTNTQRLRDTSRHEHEERVQNRAILGELLFYRLEDLHRRFVIEGYPCSAAEKQQVDRVYRHYHDELGLNGPGTHMYEEIMEAHQSYSVGEGWLTAASAGATMQGKEIDLGGRDHGVHDPR